MIDAAPGGQSWISQSQWPGKVDRRVRYVPPSTACCCTSFILRRRAQTIIIPTHPRISSFAAPSASAVTKLQHCALLHPSVEPGEFNCTLPPSYYCSRCAQLALTKGAEGTALVNLWSSPGGKPVARGRSIRPPIAQLDLISHYHNFISTNFDTTPISLPLCPSSPAAST